MAYGVLRGLELVPEEIDLFLADRRIHLLQRLQPPDFRLETGRQLLQRLSSQGLQVRLRQPFHMINHGFNLRPDLGDDGLGRAPADVRAQIVQPVVRQSPRQFLAIHIHQQP